MRILANDGIDKSAKDILENNGFEVITDKISQDELASKIIDFDVILVRSATKVTAQIIEASNLKLIGRAGVGTDNIDKVAAAKKNIPVINTPAASSISVAELVFAHLFGMARFLHLSNREMPLHGVQKFKDLKNEYSKGIELKGKTIGIIGFGRIGQETAKIAIGVGMKVMYYDTFSNISQIPFAFHPDLGLEPVMVNIQKVELNDLLAQSDFISLHVPKTEKPILAKEEFEKMKKGVGIVNCARGGVVDEASLKTALDSGKVAFAGLDVFENEPPLDDMMLTIPNVSLSPHCGASTKEAQERIGIELATQIIHHLKSSSLA